MWRPRLHLRVLIGIVLLGMGHAVGAQTNAPPAARPGTNFVAMIQGQVEIARANTDSWTGARLNQTLSSGDRVRTGDRSRAEIFLGPGVTIKLGAGSELEVPPSAGVNTRRGIFQIFNRDRFNRIQLKLPSAVAAIRGTEFVIEIGTDDQAVLSVWDGEVALTNQQGEAVVHRGEQGLVAAGQAPTVARIDLNNRRQIQWSLYYPAILDPDDLAFDPSEREVLAASIAAYRQGNLSRALAAVPWETPGNTAAGVSYRAGLLLSVGQVDRVESLLAGLPAEYLPSRALRTLLAAVRQEPIPEMPPPNSGSEWLALSYYRQLLGDLPGARAAAQSARRASARFGFAWVRLAELEFSFGNRKEAVQALRTGLDLAPEYAPGFALNGFLLASQNRINEAQQAFDHAIQRDSAYAPGWLGRGLSRFRLHQDVLALQDLFVAATLEPQRSIFRSYLGKAFFETRDPGHAQREFDLARQLDPLDPTPWLYSAIGSQQANRINQAVRELEESERRNDNRGLFRSRWLLDQDLAVRRVNLAAVYRDAGMEEISVRQAANAVETDYANFSAHLFLAHSYNALRDPNLVNLRYETPTFSEYLMANLLSPVGGTPLSQQVSQQEYSRLFERNHFGFASESVYLSSGQWQAYAVQHGVLDNLAYALEGGHQSIKGHAPNARLDQDSISGQWKQQVTSADTLYFQTVFSQSTFGDLSQYYDPANASDTLRNQEKQAPNLFIGWHHQWSPAAHTLLLLARLHDDFRARQPQARVDAFFTDDRGAVAQTFSQACADAGPGVLGPCDQFAINYHSQFEAYSAELQQIWQTPRQSLVAGARVQIGEVDTSTDLRFQGAPLAGFYFDSPNLAQSTRSQLDRYAAYAYYQRQLLDSLRVVAGLSLDRIEYPANAAAPPISPQQLTKSQTSPKLGLVWEPHPAITLRAAYSRSLGGLFYDASVRLEPVQIAGFNQVYRSLAPESVAGSIPGSRFEAWDLGGEHPLPGHTYFGWQLEALEAKGERGFGAYAGPEDFGGLRPALIRQPVWYRERSALVYLNRLLGNEWSASLKYRLTDSDLTVSTPGISAAVWSPGTRRQLARLHQAAATIIYAHPTGFFSRGQVLWIAQHNGAQDADLADENFCQANVFAGYRFPRRQAEITLGILNLFSQDYRLNPLTAYAEWPRTRTLFASLRFAF